LEATRTQESKTTSPPVRRAAAEGPAFFGGRLEANPLAALHRRLGNAAAAAWAHDAVPAVQGEAQLLPQAGEVAPVMRQVEEEEEPVLTQVEEEEEEPVQAQVEEEEEPEVQTQAEEEEEEEEPVAAKSELTVGAPGDRYEREADALAGRVMAMPEAAVQRQELEEEEPPEVQAQVEEEEEEEEPVLTQVEEEEKEPVQAQVEEEEEPEVQTQAEEEEEEQEPVAAMSELTVGAPGDRYEREADALAGRVMAMPEAAVQRRDLEEEPPEVQAQVEEEEEPEVQTQVEEEEKPVQTKGEAAPAVTPPIRAELEATRGSGEPLARDVRGFMEPRFGRDFDAVRVHTDARAGGLARQLRAQAFTRGADIYFASGKYGPYSPAGKRLLAHELTHVIQQRSVPDLQRRITSGGERDYFEREADAAAEKVVSGNEKPGGLPITPVSVLTLTGERSTSTSSVGNGGAIQLWGWGWVSRGIRSVARGVSKGVEWVGGKIAEGGKFLLGKIAPWFKSIPGYDLLTLILGKDPVSGKEVKRGGVAVVRAVMGLVPGGRAMFENLNKAGAITRAVDWISTEIAKLDLSFAAIKALFGEAWNALSPADIFNPRGAFAKLKRIFYPPIARILAFARKIGGKVLEFIFEGVLTMVGAPVKKIMAILNKGAAVLNKILKNPIGFVKNLVKAVGLGVKNFAKNILKHLKKGIVGWLFGALKSADIELPKEFDLKGVFFLVAQILGLTYANIRAKIVEKLGPGGERIVSAIEKGVSFVRDLVKRGPVVLWEKVQESLSNIKDMVFGAIKDWVVKTIVVKAIEKVLSFLNPAGAVVQAIIAIYNTVMFFVERYQQIVAFAEAVFDSIAAIASGVLGKAAAAVEGAMSRTLPVIISFLARLIGLGGIAKKIQEIIQKIRKPVDRALDKVIGWIINKGRALFLRGKAAVKKGVGKVKELIFPKKTFKVGEETHRIWVKGGRSPRMMISSGTHPIAEFLNIYEKKHGASLGKDRKEKVGAAKDLLNGDIEKTLSGIKTAKTDAEKDNLLRQLLGLEVRLSGILKGILGDTKGLAKAEEKYKLEGLTGTYSSMPKPPYDDLTPDHQPQYALFKYAVSLKAFKTEKGEAMRSREQGRGANAYVINLNKVRHQEGRTWGYKGAKTADEFKSKVKKVTKSAKSPLDVREKVVDLIKEELKDDMEKMKGVIDKSANWPDVRKLNLEPSDEKKLIKDTSRQIESGENKIGAQDLESLKGK
jgi:hypothetical protein